MTKQKLLVILLSLLLITNIWATQNTIEVLGIKLPEKINLNKNDIPVVLNGYAPYFSAEREIFVAALYTTHLESNPQNLILSDEPIAMVLYIVKEDVTPSALNQIFTEDIFVNNNSEENDLDQAKLLELQLKLNNPLNAGDILSFYYIPNQGIECLLNGLLLHHWPYGKAFFNILLRMWIGPHPPSKEFKQDLLLMKKPWIDE